MVQPAIIGDAASQARQIDGTQYAIGWLTSGLPGEAISLDTWDDLLRLRLRSILTSIIMSDAPGGLTLDSFGLINDTTIRLSYTVGNSAAHLDVALSVLFATDPPENIGLTADHGDSPTFPHGNHGHRLPTRAQAGETPIVALEHLATAPVASRGTLVGFNVITGEPEYVASSSAGISLGTSTPLPVGGPNNPRTGAGPEAAHDDHGHGIEARAVGLAELAGAPTVSDRGKAIGFDPTTGDPVTLDAGGGTFLSQTDTPSAYGTPGMAPVVDGAGTGLEFAGPYQPLLAPAPPTNLRTTDAFDMALEMRFDASPDAVTYEWQRKLSIASWPTGAGTSTTSTTVRNTAALTNSNYDFRVRSVGHGGVLASSWVEVTGIPIIATPTPAASTSNVWRGTGAVGSGSLGRT